MQLLEIRLDGVEPVGQTDETYVHADALADRASEAPVERPQHDNASAGPLRNVGDGAERPVRQGRQRDQEAFALLGHGRGEFVPAEAPGCGRKHDIALDDGAHVESARLAEASHEELERLGLPARSNRGSVGRLASSRAEVSTSSL
jgi:hypothetical protein